MSQTQVQSGFIGNNAVTTAKLDSTVSGALVPIGGIIMWTGTTIPTGWALCNGANGTPNLTNRFIVGASNTSKTGTTSQLGSSPYNPGDAGGSADATLVSHSHTPTVNDPGHVHFFQADAVGAAGNDNPDRPKWNVKQAGNYGFRGRNTEVAGTGISVSITAAGSSATNANLPPYYALAFIMRTS